MRHPDIFARQHRVQNIEPLPAGCFGRDPQARDKGYSKAGRKQPVQNDRSIVRLAIIHGRTPRSRRVMLRNQPLLSHRNSLTPIPGRLATCGEAISVVPASGGGAPRPAVRLSETPTEIEPPTAPVSPEP